MPSPYLSVVIPAYDEERRLPATLDLTIQRAPVIKSAIIASVTMLAGGLIPAIRAARQNPIDAMRHV